MGRLGSYVCLLHATDTSDRAKAKFYGDVREKLTAISTDLVFFEQRI
jgi:oligoendopeptidase F